MFLFPHYTIIPQGASFCTQKVALYQSKIFWLSDPFEVEISGENGIVFCNLCFLELTVCSFLGVTVEADQFGAEVAHCVTVGLLVAPLTVAFPLKHVHSTT